jgi:hypothetical protein
MNIKEANQIIADFMGLEYNLNGDYAGWVRNGCFLQFPYSKSLDSLIPVWEKLGYMSLGIHQFTDGEKSITMYTDNYDSDSYEYEELPNNWKEAAAIATAKAILKLEK